MSAMPSAVPQCAAVVRSWDAMDAAPISNESPVIIDLCLSPNTAAGCRWRSELDCRRQKAPAEIDGCCHSPAQQERMTGPLRRPDVNAAGRPQPTPSCCVVPESVEWTRKKMMTKAIDLCYFTLCYLLVRYLVARLTHYAIFRKQRNKRSVKIWHKFGDGTNKPCWTGKLLK